MNILRRNSSPRYKHSVGVSQRRWTPRHHRRNPRYPPTLKPPAKVTGCCPLAPVRSDGEIPLRMPGTDSNGSSQAGLKGERKTLRLFANV